MPTLFVEWSNPDHELLAEAATVELVVKLGGSPVQPTDPSAIPREFVLPDGQGEVELSFVCRGNQSSPHAGGARPILLEATQVYRIAGTQLTIEGEVHRLIDTSFVAGTWLTACLARVHTQFVDVTDYWFDQNHAKPKNKQTLGLDWAEIYEADHAHEDPADGSRLVVLGYTDGKPGLWFATVPSALRTPASDRIGCLIYYRPANYSYTRVLDDPKHSMYALDRYLLTTREDSLGGKTASKFMDEIEVKHKQRDYPFLRVGMEQALRRSGKPVLLLKPWPSGTDFGRAVTTDLPQIIEQALRFLWATQQLATNRSRIELGRLGLSGYSAAGYSLNVSFQRNQARVDELYAFDTVGMSTLSGTMQKWARRPGVKGHLTGSVQRGTANATIEAIHRILLATGESSRAGDFTVWPQGKILKVVEQIWASNAWWMNATSKLPKLRNDGTARHQFAMFGGEQYDISWLEQFLRASSF